MAPACGWNMNMLVTGCMPSGGELWLALLRVVWVAAPCCALPRSGSLPRPPGRTFVRCRFQVASVNPRWYAQSCRLLCIAKRFAVAASASIRSGDVSDAGSHFVRAHWSVNGYVYSRRGLAAAVSSGLPFPQARTVSAELPRVVSVGCPVGTSTSQCPPVAGSVTARAHPGAATAHHVSRVSADPVGGTGKTRQCGSSSAKSTRFSRTRTVPSTAST
jgi:hypothetical protein